MRANTGSGLALNRGIGVGTVLGMKEEVVVMIFLVGRDAVPWLYVEES